MTEKTSVGDRLRHLDGLCAPGCEGRCRVCPEMVVTEVIEDIERLEKENVELHESLKFRDMHLAQVAEALTKVKREALEQAAKLCDERALEHGDTTAALLAARIRDLIEKPTSPVGSQA